MACLFLQTSHKHTLLREQLQRQHDYKHTHSKNTHSNDCHHTLYMIGLIPPTVLTVFLSGYTLKDQTELSRSISNKALITDWSLKEKALLQQVHGRKMLVKNINKTTDRLISFQQLLGSHWAIQAWSSHIDIAVHWEGRQERQKGSRVQVVIIINMTQPPVETNK